MFYKNSIDRAGYCATYPKKIKKRFTGGKLEQKHPTFRRKRQIGVRAGRTVLPAKSGAGCYGILLRIKAPTESATITRAPLCATQGSANAKTAPINNNGCIIGLSESR
jgi:hypothetical protein